MKYRWLYLAGFFMVTCFPSEPVAADLKASLGLEYDDNPFEVLKDRRAGWINRFYLAAGGRLLEYPGGALWVKHQWGVKRFWRTETPTSSQGDVVASSLHLEGIKQLHQRLSLSWGGELKIRDGRQVSSEESYLHGSLKSGLEAALGGGITAGLRYRFGGDDARDKRLVDVVLHEAGLNLKFERTRSLKLRLGLNWRWLDYNRPRLIWAPHGVWVKGARDQRDQLRQVVLGVQLFRGMLIDVNYQFMDNNTNSWGYGFRAHRLQALASRHLGFGVDGQIYFTTQRRQYDEIREGFLPVGATLQDEYALNLFSLKFSKRLRHRFGLSYQYNYSRNGSRGGDAFYRKKAYALSLDVSI